MDASGNIMFGYGRDGSFNVVSLVSKQPIIVAGNMFTDQPVPSDCLALELRGIAEAISSFFLGRESNHPSSRLRTDVVDAFFANLASCNRSAGNSHRRPIGAVWTIARTAP